MFHSLKVFERIDAIDVVLPSNLVVKKKGICFGDKGTSARGIFLTETRKGVELG